MDHTGSRRTFIKNATLAGAGMALGLKARTLTLQPIHGDTPAGKRIGVIGLDTEHGPAFARLLNAPDAPAALGGFKIVAATPRGSKDIRSSIDMIPRNTEAIKAQGVAIVNSISELIPLVDLVMLETNDGRLHLEQALPVFRAGKPMFIDKPIAASLKDTLSIYRAAEKYKVPVFSSSTLRYIPSVQEIVQGKIGKVIAADVFSPTPVEPTHPDLFWYGVHGVEMLYTLLGADCRTVARTYTPLSDMVVGIWDDQRIGTLRGLRNNSWSFGGYVYGAGGQRATLGDFTGYAPLVSAIIDFFKTGRSPVAKEQTIGAIAFMEAAEISKQKNGAQIRIREIMESAEKESRKQPV
ncbi:Gfo/Idh/MocA family oxidoreductase [Niabella pedocola]|uniref:Gfo/Idh/MocA family oxidoreductase n=1 Tax=Niabella pedocola TaxID=1752077 RepID=A0ABS8PMQ6_9BACT|nr:Gfo/Idh/MocA family oxidoreductase [Niabella pedocola]MCD2422382.1 Gfo/Idh/MocA family oxidoreductase [Niabella pedocola]